jgi:hypothetical protein
MAYAHKQVSLSVIVTEAVMSQGAKHWELRQPIPGMRHNQEPIWVRHRFPIKGGKTNQEMMWWLISEKNALVQHLMRRGLIA